jgi:uncharacterized Zn finger protein
MPEASHEVIAENVVDTSPGKEQIPCQRCGGEKVHRVFREGFLQEVVYPWFGYYPWRCTTCGHLAMLRKRHRMKKHDGQAESQGRKPIEQKLRIERSFGPERTR